MKNLKFERKETKKQQSSGITLIALVITIIVLIILAGVAISMLRGENGILNRATEARYANSIAQYKEQVQLASMAVRTSIESDKVSKAGYIATAKDGENAKNLKELADEVAKELGTIAVKGNSGKDKIEGEDFTVAYYLDEAGDTETNGQGYIVIWYTNNSIRSTMNREEAKSKYGLVEATENTSVNQAVLVSVIKVENYNSELSSFGLTSTKDGGEDIQQDTFGGTSLSGKLGFTGKIPPITSAVGQPAGTPIVNPASYGENPNAQATADGADNIFALPTEASYDGTTTVDEGLVITYKGSEFVWVPINPDLTAKGTTKLMAKESTGTYAGVDENGKTNYEGVLYENFNLMTNYGQNTTRLREPSDLQNTYKGDWDTSSGKGFALIIKHINEFKSLTNNTAGQNTIKTEWPKQLQKEYNAMIESVQKYGGFYVGRYESSLSGTKAVSVAGVKPMSAASTEGDTWYGLYQKSKNFTEESDSMVSSMIWGSQYDAMLNWAKESGTTTGSHITTTGYGNHNGTGAVECGSYGNGSDVINNIYDLEGNLYEWTLEAYDANVRIRRGGGYSSTVPPSYRYANDNPFYTGTYYGSRLTLYVK